MDVEKASAQIDALIDKRSKQREEANATEMLWKQDVRKHHAKRREENRQLWRAHYEAMYRSHARLASRYARLAVELQDG